jgi:hypothetical protein
MIRLWWRLVARRQCLQRWNGILFKTMLPCINMRDGASSDSRASSQALASRRVCIHVIFCLASYRTNVKRREFDSRDAFGQVQSCQWARLRARGNWQKREILLEERGCDVKRFTFLYNKAREPCTALLAISKARNIRKRFSRSPPFRSKFHLKMFICLEPVFAPATLPLPPR